MVRLAAGASFHTHAGVVDYDALIGADEGVTIEARTAEDTRSGAARFLVVRPTLEDVVLKMPRRAQVIYPKDLGAILMAADIFPGAHVLEAGVGSGALSMTLLRAGARVSGYELRGEFARQAQVNVAALLGDDASYSVEERDVYEGIDERHLDRVVLDLAALAGRRARRGVALAGRDPACIPADHQPDGAVARAAGEEHVRDGGDFRAVAKDLAHRGALGAARSPDGRSHRVHHHCPTARQRVALSGPRLGRTRISPAR